MSQLFASGGHSTGVSASVSVLPMNIEGWFPLGLTGLISLRPRDCQESSPTPQFKSIILWHSTLFMVKFSHPYMTIGKTIALTRWSFVRKLMPLLFNMLSRLVIAFPPRSKCILISWLQSPYAVILEPKKIKVCHYFNCFPIYLPWSNGTGCHDGGVYWISQYRLLWRFQSQSENTVFPGRNRLIASPPESA